MTIVCECIWKQTIIIHYLYVSSNMQRYICSYEHLLTYVNTVIVCLHQLFQHWGLSEVLYLFRTVGHQANQQHKVIHVVSTSVKTWGNQWLLLDNISQYNAKRAELWNSDQCMQILLAMREPGPCRILWMSHIFRGSLSEVNGVIVWR